MSALSSTPGRHRREGERVEAWAARSLFAPGELARLDPMPFLPGAPLTPEHQQRGSEAKARVAAAIKFRLETWDRLVLTFPDDRPVRELYDLVAAVPLPDDLRPAP